MNETLSAHFRLSIAVLMASQFISMVASVMVMAMNILDIATTKYVDASQTVISAVDTALSLENRVSAATAYRYIVERLGKIKTVKIYFKDGIVTSDYGILLKKANIFVDIEVIQDVQGNIDVEIVEVD